MRLRARIVPRLAEARQAAGPAFDDATPDDLYQTWAWFENFDLHGRPPELESAFVLVEGAEGPARLCLPLALRARSPAAVYGPAVVALSNYYSSLFGPVAALQDSDLAHCRAAVRALRALGPAADVLDLQPLDREGAFFRAMSEALRLEGYAVDSYFCFGNWHLPCAGLDFKSYYASLSSRVRNTVQRHRKKLDKNGLWAMEFHHQPGPALENAIEQFNQVYSRSWKVPEPFPHFVPGLCRTAAREGWLRLGVLRVGDAPAAAQLWLVRNGRALIYKLAYDEAFSAFSPGSVLTCEMFRRALDDEKVVDIDYLTGDDAYKRDWMRERRERVGLVAFRRASVRGMLSEARHRLGQWRRDLRGNIAKAQAAAPAEIEHVS